MLDAYLDPEGFALKKKKSFHPLRKGMLKLIMIPKDMEEEDHPIWMTFLDPVFKTMDKIKPGGRVIIPRNTYEYLSYKREWPELLMRIKQLTLQAPLVGIYNYVIGLKED
ncbi:hypothetical protein [Pseudobutyrivibrio sp.]|uniref:hypothetical protein n=1 Tax=Pseudobutyrivibrio sp. TaxID=2014367 RepID=UPI001DB8BC1C|nr:hypothetical protein [Pseudobutyrivibrio sp.]MBE5910740.1 hypothetical protein [Pseudobutyrivibrio sp.]